MKNRPIPSDYKEPVNAGPLSYLLPSPLLPLLSGRMGRKWPEG